MATSQLGQQRIAIGVSTFRLVGRRVGYYFVEADTPLTITEANRAVVY